MEYISNKNSNFWERFQKAVPHSIPLGISDVQRYATSAILSLFDYDTRGCCEFKPLEFGIVNDYFRDLRGHDFLVIPRDILALKNAIEINDLTTAKHLEDVLISGQPLRIKINPSVYVDELKKFIDSNALWLYQKVYICYAAVKDLFLPDRSFQVMERREQGLCSYEEKVTCYNCGWKHTYIMSEKDWRTGGREKVLDAVTDAYVREIDNIDFSKVDFSCFRTLFGTEFDQVIAITKSLLMAEEVNRLNRTLKSANVITKELEKNGNQRKPAKVVLRTVDEEFCVVVWENTAWFWRRVDHAAGTILDKVFG